VNSISFILKIDLEATDGNPFDFVSRRHLLTPYGEQRAQIV
jgi:hypothetical protein